MAVRLYRNFTNWNWGDKCSMHYFNPFGGNWDPIQLMYGRTAYFELAMYGPFDFVGEAFILGCTSVYQLYEFELISQISHLLIWSLWPPFESCTVDVRTYSQFRMVCTYVLWDTWELWLYHCSETVRIGIEVTNVPCTISILLVLIWIQYISCTDVQLVLNILN